MGLQIDLQRVSGSKCLSERASCGGGLTSTAEHKNAGHESAGSRKRTSRACSRKPIVAWMTPKPVIYVVAGAWHGPIFFDEVKMKFQALGYTMICPQMPSIDAAPPTKTLHDDAAFVRAELELLIESGKEVLLVLHSYGGMVGTQAAAGLGKVERTKRGQTGGVVRLFYAAAFLLPLGFDLCKPLGGKLPPWVKEEVNGSLGLTHSERQS